VVQDNAVWLKTADRVHIAKREADGVLLTFEGCNLDDAAARVEIAEDEARARITLDPDLACGSCHPDHHLA
jgi:hypothetical protein